MCGVLQKAHPIYNTTMGDTHYTELLLTDHNHAKSIYAYPLTIH